jgi:hypothetical protein
LMRGAGIGSRHGELCLEAFKDPHCRWVS